MNKPRSFLLQWGLLAAGMLAGAGLALHERLSPLSLVDARSLTVRYWTAEGDWRWWVRQGGYPDSVLRPWTRTVTDRAAIWRIGSIIDGLRPRRWNGGDVEDPRNTSLTFNEPDGRTITYTMYGGASWLTAPDGSALSYGDGSLVRAVEALAP